MKRPVSVEASLVLALGLLGACGAAAGKTQVVDACNAKMNSKEQCGCFADTLEKGLTPEEFGKVASGIDDNKGLSELVPSSLRDDPKLGASITEAQACFK